MSLDVLMALDYSTESFAIFTDEVYETPEYGWFLEEIVMLPQDSPRNQVRLFRDKKTVNALRFAGADAHKVVIEGGGGMRCADDPQVATATGAQAVDALIAIVSEFDARSLTRDGARIVTEHLRKRIRADVCGTLGPEDTPCASPVNYGFDLDEALTAVRPKPLMPRPEVIELSRRPLLSRLFG